MRCAELREIPYVEHVSLVGGDFDILLLGRTPDNASLSDVVLERLQALDGVRSTRTWLTSPETTAHNLAKDAFPTCDAGKASFTSAMAAQRRTQLED